MTVTIYNASDRRLPFSQQSGLMGSPSAPCQEQ